MRCLSGNRLNSGSSHCRPNGSSYLRCDEARVDEMDAPVQHNASPSWPKGLRYICPRCRTGIDLGEGQSVRCAHCNFEVVVDRGVHRFISQAGAVNDWQGTYDKVATGSLGDTGAGLLYRSPLRQRVATFRHLCGEVSAGARILDVGCADGVFWQALLDRRAAIGVDFSLEMCVLARNLGMLAHQTDALALPFADEQFDLIYCAGLLEHIDDLSKLFAELSRVCCVGGRMSSAPPTRSRWPERRCAL